MTYMRRVIHPVGQGAFYTETFDKFCVVYDCGSYNDGHSMPQGAKDSLLDEINVFQPGKVDLIFISHFHMDHINGVKELLRQCGNHTKIVLPQVSKEIKALYLVSASLKNDSSLPTYTRLSQEYTEFLTRISEQIVLVSEEGQQADPITVERLRNTVFSGQKLLVDGKWMYVPVYFKSKEVDALAEQFVEESGVDVDENGIMSIEDETKWKEIVKIYKKLTRYNPGKENNVSLIVYSGPVKKAIVDDVCMPETIFPIGRMHRLSFFDGGRYYRPLRDHHSGALYVGDMECGAAWDKVNKTLGPVPDGIHHSVLDTIGLVQISHHGSWNEFNEKLANELSPSVAFCCFGSQNTYSHPTYRTLKEFLKNGFTVIPMDETGCDLDSWIDIF